MERSYIMKQKREKSVRKKVQEKEKFKEGGKIFISGELNHNENQRE